MPEIPDIDPDEAGMDAGEFSQEQLEKMEESIENGIEDGIEKTLENLGSEIPDGEKPEFEAKLKEAGPQIKESASSALSDATRDQLGGKEKPSDLDKRMNKALGEIDPDTAERLNSEIMDEALGSPPNADNLTKENIDAASKKVMDKHVETVTETISEAIGSDVSSAVDDTGLSEEEGKQATDVANEAGKGVTDPQTRGEIENEVNNPSEETKSNATKVKEWIGENWKGALGGLMKLAMVVAVIMMFTPGGASLLGKGLEAAGKAAAKAIAEVLGPLFKELWAEAKNVLGGVKKFFLYVAIGVAVLVVISLILYLFKRWLGGKVDSGGGREIEMTPAKAGKTAFRFY